MIGKTISHYKILSKLGEGGMGVVYKAKDTKLDREVALKFLPASQLGTGDDQQRFEQEAKAAAKLSHANIATVFEINEHEGETFIAMEYVDGETLSDMVEKRPLKIKDAIKIAKQIAEGLHSAHEQGIVHRDIKSANIMITAKRVVKIMDFGLAKLSKASMVTKAGTTLGTISYMSPEQTQGEKVDHRSDIWSLGVVLYEMVSGQLPFKGDYESAIIYSIMNEEPEPLTAVRTGVPMEFERIVNKLLAKEPSQRYQNIVELPVDLSNLTLQETQTSKIGSSAITETISRKKKVSVEVEYSYKTVLKALALIIPTIILTLILKPGPPLLDPERLYNSMIPLPENTTFHNSRMNRMAISPDGKDVVIVGNTGEFSGLFIKRARSFNAIALEGTHNGRAPFFSPDGRWIGYLKYTTDEIFKVLVDGGEPLKVTTFSSSHDYDGATWASDNTIVFTDSDVLKRVPESGGEAVSITKTKREGEQHLFPHMVPDGKTVLFTVGSTSNELNTYRLAVYSFGDNDYRVILDEEGYNGVYSRSGHVLYGRSGRLMGVPFDLKNLKITSIPVPVLDNISTRTTGSMSYALSTEGTIVYVPEIGSDADIATVISVDLSGHATDFFDLRMSFRYANYSPDGKYAAFVTDGQPDQNIWIYHIDGGASNQLTFYKGYAIDYFAWSPSSKVVAYATTAEDSSNSIYLRNIDGSGTARKVYTSTLPTRMYVKEWSADGSKLAFHQGNGDFNGDLFVYSFKDSSAELYLTSPANEIEPQFSPDGKWILFRSNESGNQEVYVRPYPDSKTGVWKISNGGGNKPLWSPDGKKIYYHRSNAIYRVDVSSGNVFSKGNPTKVFEGTYFFGATSRRFDIHPNGESFLMLHAARGLLQQPNIFVGMNFFEELKRLVPMENN